MNFLASRARCAALAAIASAVMSQPSMAAPFCLKGEALPPQCIYYDARDCQRDAQRQGVACGANPAELRLTRGVGQFCVITTSQISMCQYADRNSCTRDAAIQHGTCVDHPVIAPARTPDPQSPINGN